MERRQRAGRRVYSQIQQAEQGQPAQFEPVPMNQGPLSINHLGEMRRNIASGCAARNDAGRNPAADGARVISEGDYEGAFEAMKAARSGQVSQAKPFGAKTKTGLTAWNTRST